MRPASISDMSRAETPIFSATSPAFHPDVWRMRLTTDGSTSTITGMGLQRARLRVKTCRCPGRAGSGRFDYARAAPVPLGGLGRPALCRPSDSAGRGICYQRRPMQPLLSKNKRARSTSFSAKLASGFRRRINPYTSPCSLTHEAR